MIGTLGKVARLFAANYQRSHDFVRANQWNCEAGTITGPHRDLSQRARRLLAYIGNLLRLSVLGHLADRIGGADLLVLDRCDQLFAQTVGCPQPEKLLHLVENVDGTGLRARKLDCLGDDRGQHGLKIEGGVDRLADLAERLQLFDRVREFACARLHLVEQPHVLDRDHRLVGEGGHQFDLLVAKGSDLRAEQRHYADGLAFAQQRDPKGGAKAGHFLTFEIVFRISQDIVNLNGFAFKQDPTRDRPAARHKSSSLCNLNEPLRKAEARGIQQDVILRLGDRGLIRFAQPRRGLDQRIEYGAEVERRAADDLEHVGGGGLL